MEMITQKEKDRIENKVKDQLYSGVNSILRWTVERASFAGRGIFRETDLLDMAIKLEVLGLLAIPKKQRRLLMERALSVLNCAEARAKSRIFSAKELLETALKIENLHQSIKGN